MSVVAQMFDEGMTEAVEDGMRINSRTMETNTRSRELLVDFTSREVALSLGEHSCVLSIDAETMSKTAEPSRARAESRIGLGVCCDSAIHIISPSYVASRS